MSILNVDPIIYARFLDLASTLKTQNLLGSSYPCIALTLDSISLTAIPEFQETATPTQIDQVNVIISGWNWTQQLDEAKASTIDSIHIKTSTLMEHSIPVSINGVTVNILCDSECGSINYYNLLCATSIKGSPYPINIIQDDRTIVQITTNKDLDAVWTALFNRRNTLMTSAIVLINQIKACTTVAQVLAIQDNRT